MNDVASRLCRAHFQEPVIDRDRIDKALRRHLRELGLPARRIVWTEDGEAGFWQSSSGAGDHDWESIERAAWDVASFPAEDTRRLGNGPEPRIWNGHPGVAAAFHEAWAQRDRALYLASVSRTVNEYLGPVADPRAAGVVAALAALPDGRAWAPFLDAFEAGLWIFWVLREELIAVPRPSCDFPRGRLHSAVGPAVRWPGGQDWWMLNNVRVPRHVVEDPTRIRMSEILDEPNAEVRRILIERYGPGRFLQDLGEPALQEDVCGALFRIPFAGDEPLVMVRVRNATPEPDGTRREYFLRVPPWVSSAREAVAWTFGLSVGSYATLEES